LTIKEISFIFINQQIRADVAELVDAGDSKTIYKGLASM
jgi:hypothetical protein